MTKAANGKVLLDLTPIHKGIIECDALIDFNSLEQPESITVIIRELNAQQINHFCKGTLAISEVFGSPAFKGIMDGAVSITGELDFIKGVGFGPAEAHLECYLGGSTRITSADTEVRHLVFRLANYRISGGDAWTDVPLPKNPLTPEKIAQMKEDLRQYHKVIEGTDLSSEEIDMKYDNFKVVSGGKRRNRIVFNFAEREWILDDDYHGRWPKDDTKITEPVGSGTLSTGFRENDNEQSLQQAADDITDLLTLALGRDIKWISLGRQLEDGTFQFTQDRRPSLLAFNQNRHALVDNWEPHNVKAFIERGEKALASDRVWWSVTIGLLTEVGGTKYLVIKCSLLNTLLDRITSKVNGESNTSEIDAELDDKLDDESFRVTLHTLLSSLTDKWERHRTDSLCNNVIKGWNAEPSFPEKVIRSCEALGIEAPSRTKLGYRHKIMHVGEFDRKLKGIEKKVEYLIGINAVVLMLLVRMLGFEGYIYLPSIPPEPNHKKVSEFLAGSP